MNNEHFKAERELCKKLWFLLDDDYKKRAMVLVLVMFIAMLLELMSVGAVIPVIGILLQNDELTTQFPILANYHLHYNHTSLIVLAMGAITLIYIIKNMFLAYSNKVQFKFVYELQRDLTDKLFRKYMHEPYKFFLQNNTAILARNVTGEMTILVTSVMIPVLAIMAEAVVVMGLCLLMFYISFVGSLLSVIVVLAFACFFVKITKSKIRLYGDMRLFYDGQKYKFLQQALQGIKDIKILHAQEYFIDQFSHQSKKSSEIYQKYQLLLSLPRLLLEVLAIVGLSTLLIVLSAQKMTGQQILPIVAMFAAIAFRLTPSLNRILAFLNQVRFGVATLHTVYRELQEPQKPLASQRDCSFEDNITFNQVVFSHEGQNKTIIDGISFVIRKGEMIGIVGASGSGKSTLMDLLLGLLAPVSGEVCVDGVDISQVMQSWQSRIGYVPQSIYLTDDTLKRNIAFGLKEDEINDIKMLEAIQLAQLEDFITTLPEGLETKVGERGVRLSGGQRQRIGIARALYTCPDVLVFDEATSALDNDTEAEVIKAIENLRGIKTVVIVAHRLSTIQHCDRIYKVDAGKLVS